MYTFKCPECGKEEYDADPTATHECGDCNFPTNKGITLEALGYEEEPEEISCTPEKTQFIEEIVKMLIESDNINHRTIRKPNALIPYTMIKVEIIIHDKD